MIFSVELRTGKGRCGLNRRGKKKLKGLLPQIWKQVKERESVSGDYNVLWSVSRPNAEDADGGS